MGQPTGSKPALALLAAAAIAGCAGAPRSEAPAAMRAEPLKREVMVNAQRPVRTFTLCFAHGLDEHWPDLEHNVARLPGNAFEVRTQAFRQAPMMVNRVQGTPRGIALTTLVYFATPPAEEWLEAVDEAIEDCDAKRLQ